MFVLAYENVSQGILVNVVEEIFSEVLDKE